MTLLLQDLANHEDRVHEVNQLADKLITDQHPEQDTVAHRQRVGGFIYAVIYRGDTAVV